MKYIVKLLQGNWLIPALIGFTLGIGFFYLISSVDKTIWLNLLTSELFWGFVLGMAGTYITSFLNRLIIGNKIVREAERAILRAVSEKRLQRIGRTDDRHWIIRTEWAANLRDLGSTRPKDIIAAANELYYMADLLNEDERILALDALRFRMGQNKSPVAIDKFIKAMKRLQDNGSTP